VIIDAAAARDPGGTIFARRAPRSLLFTQGKDMPIDVSCDACGARFKAPDAAAGKRGKCKKCGAAITVPVPEPVPAAAAEDDMYDIAEPDAAPAKPYRPATAAPAVAPAPAYNPPPASAAQAAMMARGVVPKSAAAESWKNAHNPPRSFQILKGIGGAILLLIGLVIAGGAVYGMMNPDKSLRRPIRAIIFGGFLIVTGIGLLAQSMGIGGMFDED
jgi:hypothetical protein